MQGLGVALGYLLQKHRMGIPPDVRSQEQFYAKLAVHLQSLVQISPLVGRF